jgi:hypothetical protein
VAGTSNVVWADGIKLIQTDQECSGTQHIIGPDALYAMPTAGHCARAVQAHSSFSTATRFSWCDGTANCDPEGQCMACTTTAFTARQAMHTYEFCSDQSADCAYADEAAPLCGHGLGSCADTGANSYTCDCNDGYTFSGGTCAEIFPCEDSEVSTCDPNSTCNHDGPGLHSCACNVGYSGDGTTCSDTNGCANSPCFDHAEVACHDTPAPEDGFTCDACPSGYNGNGITCSDIDDCADTPCGAAEAGSCADTGPNSYQCTCNAGFTGDVTCVETAPAPAPAPGDDSVDVCPGDFTSTNGEPDGKTNVEDLLGLLAMFKVSPRPMHASLACPQPAQYPVAQAQRFPAGLPSYTIS